MGRVDPLRRLIHRGIEAYELGSYPDISMIYGYSLKWGIDPDKHQDVYDLPLTTVRPHLLQYGIDIKRTLDTYLANIPQNRATILLNWIQDGSQYAEYSLSHYQRINLKNDRKTLKIIYSDKGYK